jgi:hypothetical protein
LRLLTPSVLNMSIENKVNSRPIPAFHSGHAYVAYEREIDAASTRLKESVHEACGYSTSLVHARLMQRLVELTLGPYATLLARRRKAGLSPIPPAGTVVDCAAVRLTTGAGQVSLSWYYIAKGCLEFFVHWVFVLISILAGLRPGGDSRPATLVFGVGQESILIDGSDTRFTSYCRSGPILPLRNGTRFLVETICSNGVINDADFCYVRRPMIALLREAKIGVRRRLSLLARHLMLSIGFFRSIIRDPMLALLGRDFAYVCAVRAMDEAGAIEAIIQTCSNFTIQSLWMRGDTIFSTHMIWYAQNWKPLVYADDDFESHIPNLRWIHIGTHWIWTSGFGDYLRSLGTAGTMQAVGPIMWYQPEYRTPPSDHIEIMLFDLMPFSDEYAEFHGEMENYWRPQHLHEFVAAVLAARDPLSVRFGCPVVVRLKQKRGYNVVYDRGYFDFIDTLVRDGKLQVVPPSENIFALISASHAVIVYPYSSPAHVSSHLEVPAVYFDPTGTLRPSFEKSPWIDFANSRDNLMETLTGAILRRRSLLGSADN